MVTKKSIWSELNKYWYSIFSLFKLYHETNRYTSFETPSFSSCFSAYSSLGDQYILFIHFIKIWVYFLCGCVLLLFFKILTNKSEISPWNQTRITIHFRSVFMSLLLYSLLFIYFQKPSKFLSISSFSFFIINFQNPASMVPYNCSFRLVSSSLINSLLLVIWLMQ